MPDFIPDRIPYRLGERYPDGGGDPESSADRLAASLEEMLRAFLARRDPACRCLDPVVLGHTERRCPLTMVPRRDMGTSPQHWASAALRLEQPRPSELASSALRQSYAEARSARMAAAQGGQDA